MHDGYPRSIKNYFYLNKGQNLFQWKQNYLRITLFKAEV